MTQRAYRGLGFGLMVCALVFRFAEDVLPRAASYLDSLFILTLSASAFASLKGHPQRHNNRKLFVGLLILFVLGLLLLVAARFNLFGPSRGWIGDLPTVLGVVALLYGMRDYGRIKKTAS